VPTPAAPVPAAQTATTTTPMAGSGQPAVLDESRVRALTAAAEERRRTCCPRRAGQPLLRRRAFADAIKWYEQALALDPKNVNVSTDLAVSYYYTNQPDRALAQFDVSLGVDPRHTKTLLNQGIVRAFGKQDLDAAAQSWQK